VRCLEGAPPQVVWYEVSDAQNIAHRYEYGTPEGTDPQLVSELEGEETMGGTPKIFKQMPDEGRVVLSLY